MVTAEGFGGEELVLIYARILLCGEQQYGCRISEKLRSHGTIDCFGIYSCEMSWHGFSEIRSAKSQSSLGPISTSR